MLHYKVEPRNRGQNFGFFARGVDLILRDALGDERRDLTRLDFAGNVAFLDRVGIEQIGNEIAHPRARFVDRLGQFCRHLEVRAFAHDLRVADDDR